MYSGVLKVFPSIVISPGCVICIMTGVAFGVVGELSSMPKEVTGFGRERAAKSTFSAGGPSTRLASISF